MLSSTTYSRVIAPARLHLGFLDLNGKLGRRFGSIGLAIDDLDTCIEAAVAQHLEVEGEGSERVRDFAARVLANRPEKPGARVRATQVAAAHQGLGSGTQLGLAVAAAITRAYGTEHTARELATMVGRGDRSGVGVAAFAQGGLVIDGGRSLQGGIAPLLARFEFPAAWRIVLVFDDAMAGLHGAAERGAFATLPAMSASDAAELARWCLMGLMPAVAEHDFRGVARAVAAIQARVGRYFAPAQRGGLFTSPRVAHAVQTLSRCFALDGIGQSSWGPTGFVLVPHEERADDLLTLAARERWPGIRLQAVGGRNHGATIETITRT